MSSGPIPGSGIGTIKYFDKETKGGLISPSVAGLSPSVAGLIPELYFEINSDDEARKLHVGDLVQFVIEGKGSVVTQVKHLSRT